MNEFMAKNNGTTVENTEQVISWIKVLLDKM